MTEKDPKPVSVTIPIHLSKSLHILAEETGLSPEQIIIDSVQIRLVSWMNQIRDQLHTLEEHQRLYDLYKTETLENHIKNHRQPRNTDLPQPNPT